MYIMDFLKLKIGIRKYCQLFFMLMAIILTIGTSQAAGSGAVKKTSVNMDKWAKTKKLEDAPSHSCSNSKTAGLPA